MKKMVVIPLIIFLSSCNSKDEQFCKCLKAGEELNDFSSTLMNGEITTEKSLKLKELRTVKTRECEDYKTMNGPELLKRKAECQ